MLPSYPECVFMFYSMNNEAWEVKKRSWEMLKHEVAFRMCGNTVTMHSMYYNNRSLLRHVA